MHKHSAVICGYYGKGNAGDEALLISLLQMLPLEVKPIVLSGNPQETSKLYGVESCDRTSGLDILRIFKNSQYFIWGGGSLMQDATSLASPLYYGGLMGLAQQQGLKTIAWAQGIGPLQRSFTRWLTKSVLQGCVAVSVRDSASAKLVADWQIKPLIAPDPVWALESKPIKVIYSSQAPKIAVCLRPHPQLTPSRLMVIAKALKEFQETTNTFILLVPLQKSQDLAIAESLAAELKDNYQIVTAEDPRELKGLFKEVELTIGMRLHSLIMAAAEQSRCFALSYDPKVTQLQRELDLPGYELDRIPQEPTAIAKAWLEYYANGEPLNSVQIQSLIDRALMHRDLLKQVLRGN
jgi:polysaccharide pyruvyl transferase CsaB